MALSLRRREVLEAYLDIIKEMHRDCTTRVVTAVGETVEIEIELGLLSTKG